jgi:hypothetical protein
MNLHAHPYTVAAELAWKQESLSHANRTSRRRSWRLPRPRRAVVLARRTDRPSAADTAGQHAWPTATGLAAR